MLALAETLSIPVPHAVGIMEMLWHFTGQYAPQGNIGKFPDTSIARACLWPVKEAERLLEGLVSCGWFDPDPEHRYLVHDFREHAEESVKIYLKRKNLLFFQCAPVVSRHVATNIDNVETCRDQTPFCAAEAVVEAKGKGQEAEEENSEAFAIPEQPPAKPSAGDEFHIPKFQEIMGVFIALGRGSTWRDEMRCQEAWKALPLADKLAAHAHVRESLNEWKSRPTAKIAQPWNYLEEQHWKRHAPRLLPITRAPTKAEEAQRLASDEFSRLNPEIR